LNCRQELDRQNRLVTMRKQREKEAEINNDKYLLARQSMNVQEELKWQMDQQEAARQYQKHCVSSSLHEKLKYLNKQKEDAEREKQRLNAEYEKMLKQAEEVEKAKMEQKLRIADTLRAVYKQQEQDKKIKYETEKYVDKVTQKMLDQSLQNDNPYTSYELQKDAGVGSLPPRSRHPPSGDENSFIQQNRRPPSKQKMEINEQQFPVAIEPRKNSSFMMEENSNAPSYSQYYAQQPNNSMLPPVQPIGASLPMKPTVDLYGVGVIGDKRVINVPRHQTRRLFRQAINTRSLIHCNMIIIQVKNLLACHLNYQLTI